MNSHIYSVTESAYQNHILYPVYVKFRDILIHMCACEKQLQQEANELAKQGSGLDAWLLIIDQQKLALELQEKLIDLSVFFLPIEFVQQLGRIGVAHSKNILSTQSSFLILFLEYKKGRKNDKKIHKILIKNPKKKNGKLHAGPDSRGDLFEEQSPSYGDTQARVQRTGGRIHTSRLWVWHRSNSSQVRDEINTACYEQSAEDYQQLLYHAQRPKEELDKSYKILFGEFRI
jgi:hypothetical protein